MCFACLQEIFYKSKEVKKKKIKRLPLVSLAHNVLARVGGSRLKINPAIRAPHLDIKVAFPLLKSLLKKRHLHSAFCSCICNYRATAVPPWNTRGALIIQVDITAGHFPSHPEITSGPLQR